MGKGAKIVVLAFVVIVPLLLTGCGKEEKGKVLFLSGCANDGDCR